MSIRTVYVEAASKAEINRRLKVDNNAFECVEFKMGQGDVFDLERMPAGTVVKIWSKLVGGVPYAKAYGNVAYTKAGRVFLK